MHNQNLTKIHIVCHLCMLTSEPHFFFLFILVGLNLLWLICRSQSACETGLTMSLWSSCQSEESNLSDVIRQSGKCGCESTKWYSGCAILVIILLLKRKRTGVQSDAGGETPDRLCGVFLSSTHTYVTVAQTEGADGCKSCTLGGADARHSPERQITSKSNEQQLIKVLNAE